MLSLDLLSPDLDINDADQSFKLKHMTLMAIDSLLDTSLRAANLFFNGPEVDMINSVFFENGYKFLERAKVALIYKLNNGTLREKAQADKLFDKYLDLLNYYYAGFK